ncbi:major facilitator superfamily protein [Klebsiella pneumoniae]|nr:major facilitator superfamily protein [Klebsiella pneumoniae]
MSGIIAFFRASPPKAGAAFDEHRFRRVRWQTFIAMTLAYVTFYVCRLSFTVAKSALVELGITPTELGMIGSTLFFSYAIGKLVNGFIADHANVVRYMSLGLLLSAGMNLMMGMTTNALLLAIFWGINGWAQSMGVGPCAVSLARWYGVKERGTFYGIWSTAHNIGEAGDLYGDRRGDRRVWLADGLPVHRRARRRRRGAAGAVHARFAAEQRLPVHQRHPR